MKLAGQAPLRVTAAAMSCTAILVPAALALAGCAAGAGVPASAARPAGPVTAYVVNYDSGTVTQIRTATNTALKPVRTGLGPDAIAITPDGQTAYVANGSGGGDQTAANSASRDCGREADEPIQKSHSALASPILSRIRVVDQPDSEHRPNRRGIGHHVIALI